MLFKQMYAAHIEAEKNREGEIGDFFFEVESMKQEGQGWFVVHDKGQLSEFFDKYPELWEKLPFSEGIRYTKYSDFLQDNLMNPSNYFSVKFI